MGKEKTPAPGQLPLQQLLGSIPTPARASPQARPQTSTLTSTAPPTAQSASVVPPPPPGAPPMLPVAACQSRLDQLELSRMMSPPLSEPTFTSYRERLRASGRCAFQRAYDIGLLPKAMKQDAALAARAESQFQTDVRSCTPMSTPMSYVSSAGNTPMSMHSSDCWSMHMDPSSMQPNCPSQQIHMMAQQSDTRQMSQMQYQMSQMLPYSAMPQHPQQHQLALEASSPHSSQVQVGMQMSQMQPQHMQMSQMHISQVQPPQTHLQVAANGDTTPTEIDRCMRIVMNGAPQYDKNMMAAQLQATADCQCYED